MKIVYLCIDEDHLELIDRCADHYAMERGEFLIHCTEGPLRRILSDGEGLLNQALQASIRANV